LVQHHKAGPVTSSDLIRADFIGLAIENYTGTSIQAYSSIGIRRTIAEKQHNLQDSL
jgi:hypothetical protein